MRKANNTKTIVYEETWLCLHILLERECNIEIPERLNVVKMHLKARYF